MQEESRRDHVNDIAAVHIGVGDTLPVVFSHGVLPPERLRLDPRPESLSRAGVRRHDMTPIAGHADELAVDVNRRGAGVHVRKSGPIPNPCHLELLEVVRVDLVQCGVSLAIRVSGDERPIPFRRYPRSGVRASGGYRYTERQSQDGGGCYRVVCFCSHYLSLKGSQRRCHPAQWVAGPNIRVYSGLRESAGMRQDEKARERWCMVSGLCHMTVVIRPRPGVTIDEVRPCEDWPKCRHADYDSAARADFQKAQLRCGIQRIAVFSVRENARSKTRPRESGMSIVRKYTGVTAYGTARGPSSLSVGSTLSVCTRFPIQRRNG